MSAPFCNVALPVPLRTTFTYAVPDAGKIAAEELGTNVLLLESNGEQSQVLIELAKKGQSLPPPSAIKLGFSSELLQRLQRRELIEIRESVKGRKRKTQRIIAWK